ncbi:aminotransferase class III-fold pyridoxal phosphate-dependent enzyme [Pirellulales bacterium]|nr:aminotransferase class III-fold pyridoxal phosphate-dependent enzyme [Pirellulales bacterium]
MTFHPVSRSLVDLLGRDYMEQVTAASAFFDGTMNGTMNGNMDRPLDLAEQATDFYPEALQRQLTSLLDRVGARVIDQPLQDTAPGAGSAAFCQAMSTEAAPLSARGYYRVGEDGRLYLVTKSEHYHASLGHSFRGYKLVENARALGIPNATHNNTRGFITRLLETELIRTANGLDRDDHDGLNSVLGRQDDMRVLNRVLNLETGSLAVEAALKMTLARFYRMDANQAAPKYEGRTPVILVMGDDEGDLQANYHGTTTLTQMLRGMWPGLREAMEQAKLWKVVTIRPNCADDLDRAFKEYDQGNWKIAGFFHEIIMMNYGARRLTREFLARAYDLCDLHDVPTVADEIQSCMWSSQLYLFREYGLQPTLLAIGKGFSGGEYPASRLLFSAAMDCMPQFGALVTNGQEELASLAYLITMEWVTANGDKIEELGAYYHERLRGLVDARHGQVVDVVGWNHMSALVFQNLDQAKNFTSRLRERCLDISAQSYKASCPPVAMTKLPLTADRDMIDFVLKQMVAALHSETPRPRATPVMQVQRESTSSSE